MDKNKLKTKAKTRLKDISSLIDELRFHIVNESIRVEYEELIKKMETISENIRKKYEDIEKSGDERWNEFDKNIYHDLESFNNAYKKAGSLFKPIKDTSRLKKE